jgi:hypothetical protein
MEVDGELAATGVVRRAVTARTRAARVARAAAVLAAMATPATPVVIRARVVLAPLHPRGLRGSTVATRIVRVLGFVTRAAHIAGRVVTIVARLRDGDPPPMPTASTAAIRTLAIVVISFLLSSWCQARRRQEKRGQRHGIDLTARG